MRSFLTGLGMLALLAGRLPQDAGGEEEKKKAQEEAKTQIKAFKETTKTCKTEDEYCTALKKLGEVRHKLVLDELKIWLGKMTNLIRQTAADEIGKYQGDKEAANVLLSGFNAQREEDMRVYIIEKLGEVKCKAVARSLNALFRDRSVKVSAAAVGTAGQIRSKDSIDPLISLASELEQVQEPNQPGGPSLPGPAGGGVGPNTEDERYQRKLEVLPTAISALKSITGEKWAKAQEWRLWWARNKEKFKELE